MSSSGIVEVKPILCHRKEVTVKDVIVQAWGYFSAVVGNLFNFVERDQLMMRDIDPVRFVHIRRCFQEVRAKINEKVIEAHITKASTKKLMLKKSKFQWTDPSGNMYNDGPIMLKMILNGINPSTWVGVSALKAHIEKASLSKYGNNVGKMLIDMRSKHHIIMSMMKSTKILFITCSRLFSLIQIRHSRTLFNMREMNGMLAKIV